MNKLLTITLFLINCTFINTIAQYYKTIDNVKYIARYLYEYQVDSSDITNRKTVEMPLYIGNKLSKFANSETFRLDSIGLDEDNTIVPEGQDVIIDIGNGTTYLTRYTIIKELNSNNTTMYEYIYDDHKILDQINFKWQLTANTDTTISGYPCKKATTLFAGRKYSAWYTTNIPINDGPYKFKGLPGLIIKICDTKNQHIFTLTSFCKVNYQKPIILSRSEGKEIDYKEYVRLIKMKQAEFAKMVYNMDLGSNESPYEIEMRNKKKNNFIEKF